MDSDNKQPKTSGIRMALERLFLRRVYQPDKPYIPQPDKDQGDFIAGLDADIEYSEMEADVSQLFVTSTIFGKQRITQVDENGRAKDISKAQSYRIGSNKIVSKIEDIVGICSRCEGVAVAAYKAGQISLQQAQLNSMYDRGSAAKCDLCNKNMCDAHCRPVQIEEVVHHICDICLKQIEAKRRRQKVINFLLAPFIESEEKQQ